MKFVILLMLVTQAALAEEKVIIKYKDYEKIDLGDFSIQGDIITPGDLSVKERKSNFSHSDLYEKIDFDDLNLLDGGN